MENLTKFFIKSKKFQSYMENIEKKEFPISLSGLTDLAKAHFSYATSYLSNKPMIIITYNEICAKKLAKDLKFFGKEVVLFPKKEIVSYDIETESREILNQRVKVMHEVVTHKNPIIVTTIEAICQKMICKNDFQKYNLKIDLNHEYNLDELKQTLINLGYENCKAIEGKGQFSIRGGIVDVSPVNIEEGIRIELWGDEVDSIRLFNIETQRSIKNINEITIYPCTEFLLIDSLDNIIKNIPNVKSNDLEAIQNGNYQNKMQKYFDSFYNMSESFLNYLDENYIIFVDEALRVKQRLNSIIEDNGLIVETLIEKQKDVPDGFKNVLTYEEYLKILKNKQIVYLEKLDNKFVDKQNMHAKRNGYSFDCREVNFFRSGMALFLEEIKEKAKSNRTIAIYAGNESNVKKIKKFLEEAGINSVVNKNIEENKINILENAFDVRSRL